MKDIHSSYVDVWYQNFPDTSDFKLKRKSDSFKLTSGSFFVYIVEFSDILNDGCININTYSSDSILFADFCISKNCSSSYDSTRAGFLKFNSKGRSKIKNVFCYMNTVYGASFSGQSILLNNDYSEISISSFDRCFGSGEQSGTLRYVCDIDVSSLNETNLDCSYCPVFKGLRNINVSFCSFSSNFASRTDILLHTGKYNFFLTKCIILNNTTPLSLVCIEGGSRSIVSKCSFVMNNSTMCFRSNVFQYKNSSMIVENCSLIDNIYKYSYATGIDCVVDVNNIGTQTFFILLSLKRLETLPRFIDIKISCNAIHFCANLHNVYFLGFILFP